jgi:hypothetical protein
MIDSITMSTPSESVTLTRTTDEIERTLRRRPGREASGGDAADPRARFEVPAERDFYSDQFIEAPTLQRIGQALIAKWPELADLHQVRIRYLWRKKGSVSAGKNVLGKSTKQSGLAAYFGDCDFTVIIAADFARQYQLTNHQMEACIYHELRHIQVSEDEETGELILSPRAHDAELVYDEITRYGFWADALKGTRDVITQLGLDLTGEGE